MKKHLRPRVLLTLAVLIAMMSLFVFGQTPQTPAHPSAAPGVPRLLKFSGVLKDASGNTLSNTVGVIFAIYSEQTGGVPLWQETQNVQVAQGRYTVFLGASASAGIPAELFASGQPRWLGVRALLPDEEEQPRVLLASVPYALKAVDADTLGGLPASAFIQVNGGKSGNVVIAPATAAGSSKHGVLPPSSTVTTSGGTVGTIAEFDTTTDIKSSPIVDLSGVIGIKNLESIRFADQFPGSDCGVKINAADSNLAAHPGEIWVNNNCGTAITTPVVINSNHVLRFTQGGLYTFAGGGVCGTASNVGICLSTNALLSGASITMVANVVSMTELQNAANLTALVGVANSNVGIEDIVLDGNKSGFPTGGSGILLTNTAAINTEIDRVTVGNFVQHGINLTGGANVRIFKVQSYQNSGDGIYCIGSSTTGGDGFVLDSAIENNTTNGIELNSCPAWRINHSDFGLNSFSASTGCALNIYATGSLNSNFEIITNNQFGSNFRHDLCINGFSGGLISSSGSNIANNSFIGGSRLAGNTYNDIVLIDGGANVITGNAFNASSGKSDANAIKITSPNNSLGNLIRSNVFIDNLTNSGSPAFGNSRILDQTPNGITCLTANLVLGSGWGTSSSVTLNNGVIPSCIYTITSGSGSFSASPTVTYNFPGSLVQVFNSSSPICQLTVVSITGSGGAIIFNPTVASGTQNVWTAQTSTGAAFTPAASETYKVVLSCSP